MAKKSREDDKAQVNAPSPYDQQWDQDAASRKRHFDVDGIVDSRRKRVSTEAWNSNASLKHWARVTRILFGE